MKEHPEREEKLTEREIRFAAPAGGPRAERPHGKLYRWFDNYWYHYKWHTIAVAFLAMVVLVCTLQMCRKEPEADLTLVLAGPYSFTADGEGLSNLQNCLGTYLPTDVDGDGERRVKLVTYSLYSEDELAALEEGQTVDRYLNTQQHQQYNSYLKTGNASIFFLSPSLFAELSAQSAVLVDLTTLWEGDLPAGALVTTDGAGASHCYGVRLGDTALYGNSAVRALPADTVICLMGPFVFGNNSNEAVYAAAVAYMKELSR